MLGIPVAALSTIDGGRDFFRGKTLNAGDRDHRAEGRSGGSR